MSKSIFSEDNVNSGRQIELDIARGLAVLFMILVHVLETLSTPDVLRSTFGLIIQGLGGPPAAPVFMFLLGIGLVYSKKTDSTLLFKRGVLLLLGGYLLNIFRAVIPFSIAINNKVINEALIPNGNVYHLFFDVDIFQFAGLTFIFMGILKLLKMPPWGYVIVAVAFALLNLMLQGISFDNYYLNSIFGLIWGTNSTSYFPFLSWIFYPTFGYYFGTLLIKCNNTRKLYFNTFTIFMITGTVGTIIAFLIPEYDFGLENEYRYYHQDLLSNLVYVSFIIIWIGFLRLVTQILPTWINERLKKWSREVTVIYVIQWILIGWAVIFVGIRNLGMVSTLILMIAFTFASDIIATFFYKIKKIKLKRVEIS